MSLLRTLQQTEIAIEGPNGTTMKIPVRMDLDVTVVFGDIVSDCISFCEQQTDHVCKVHHYLRPAPKSLPVLDACVHVWAHSPLSFSIAFLHVHVFKRWEEAKTAGHRKGN